MGCQLWTISQDPENRKQWWEDGDLHLALSPACEPCTPNLHGDCPDPGPARAAPLHLRPVSSAAQSSPTLCDPMDCSTPGFPVHHQLWELAQTHVHPVGPSNHLILCHPFFLLPSIFPSIRVFSNSIKISQIILATLIPQKREEKTVYYTNSNILPSWATLLSAYYVLHCTKHLIYMPSLIVITS